MNSSFLCGVKEHSLSRKTFIETQGPWQLPCNARLLCPDGVCRLVKRIAITPTTMWTLPATITYKGKTVSGAMLCPSDDYCIPDNMKNEYRFVPYGKNRDIFK